MVYDSGYIKSNPTSVLLHLKRLAGRSLKLRMNEYSQTSTYLENSNLQKRNEQTLKFAKQYYSVTQLKKSK